MTTIKNAIHINIECPKCHQKKKIRIPIKIINQSTHLTTISLPGGFVCEHSFHAFIDKDLKIRGYQKIDYEISRMKIFENSPSAIMLVSMQGIILDCNRASEQLFGYEKEDLINQIFMDTLIFPIDELPIFIERYQAIFDGEIPEPKETKIKKNDGSFVWVSLQETIAQLDEEPIFIVMIQNIDDLKEAQRIIKNENKRLKEIDELRKEFVIRATHELKTPLTSMSGASELLFDMYQAIPDRYKFLFPEKFSIFLRDIFESTSRLKELALNLLDFSRLESGTFQLKEEKVNSSEIIKECVKSEELQSKKRKINIYCNLPPKLFLYVDKIRLTQVFQNLISNALKNTPMGGKITIGFEKNKKKVKFLVKDTGVGLTFEEKNKLFTKFCKIERNKKGIIKEGFGCGLYITKQIVKSHNGEIWAESEGRDKGATFIVELPIK